MKSAYLEEFIVVAFVRDLFEISKTTVIMPCNNMSKIASMTNIHIDICFFDSSHHIISLNGFASLVAFSNATVEL